MTDYTYVTIDDPQADDVPGGGTNTLNINDNNVILGGTLSNYQFAQYFTYTNFTFTNIDDDILNATCLNNLDSVAGIYRDTHGIDHGFIYSASTFTLLQAGTQIYSINDSNAVVGEQNIDNVKQAGTGFLYNGGVYTSISDPNGTTTPFYINNEGDIVGWYYSSGNNLYGFIYQGGVYTTISDPLQAAASTECLAINNGGELIGNYQNADGKEVGFSYVSGGYTNISDPYGTNGTYTQAINDSGEITGMYLDNQNIRHGFVYENGSYTTIDPIGSVNTYVGSESINNDGEIAGSYTDSSGVEHGFIAEPVCFCVGARILTERGEVPVEQLRVGDMAIALRQGRFAPVRWIGHARVQPSRYLVPAHVHPVRIQAGAFGDGAPNRDLWLTPGHRVMVDGYLVQIDALLNDATIAQIEQDEFDVWHVELDRHDVLLANGLPTESYLEAGNRGGLTGSNVVPLRRDLLSPGDETQTCAPILRDEAALATLRARLAARAEALGWTLTDDPALCVVAEGLTLPSTVAAGRYVFKLLRPTSNARLICRTQVPSRMAPDTMDARRLGVAVAGLVIDGVALSLEALNSGFYPLERDRDGAFRWTNGDALLPRGRTFQIETVHPRRYWSCGDMDRAAPLITRSFSRNAASGRISRKWF